MAFTKSRFLLISILFFTYSLQAQNQPVGYWSSLMAYNTAIGVATDGYILYTISKGAFFTVDTKGQEIIGYSKVNGMSDIGMQNVAYDATTGSAILVYANGNIDIFKDKNFYNIPDFKLKTVAGDKSVSEVYTENGKAYLSSTLGIMVVDLAKHKISETYQFYTGNQLVAIKSFAGSGNYFYAITASGLYRAKKSSLDLQNFQTWQKTDSTHGFSSIKVLNEKLFLIADTALYVMANDTANLIFTDSDKILNINPGNDRLFITLYHPFKSFLKVIDTNYQVINHYSFYDKGDGVVQLLDGTVWVANEFTGLTNMVDSNTVNYYGPLTPGDITSFDIYANNGELYVAHGGYDGSYLGQGNHNGISIYKEGKWHNYKRVIIYPYEPFADSMADFVTILKDETDGTVYAGSFSGGLFELHTDNSYKIYKQGSILERSIPNAGINAYQVIGSALDHDGNYWLTMFGSYDELYVKEKTTANWYKYHLNIPRSYPFSGGPITIDDANHIWYASLYGGGVIGYNTNNTLSDISDDEVYHLIAGKGFGNLPNTATTCIVQDKNDNLWIGTTDGIGILYNASSCLGQHCDAEIPIVQYDKFAGYLFSGQRITSIAIDGANRKWVGSDNGVWLLSPDAGNSTIISRFTIDNSPLPSNHIQKITIDKVTGVVYIGTEAGLVSYRGTATEGGETNAKVITYPNPVPAGYRGTIAIKGLATNADVRITDISGQLVYRTTALGGQAVWNGLDYKGHRPQSGVYLIFASSSDGAQVFAGKMVFMN